MTSLDTEIEFEELLESFDLEDLNENVIEVDKRDIQKAFKKGQQCCRQGQWAEAVKHLLTVWSDRPTDKAVLILLAFALVQLGVREQAIKLLEKVLQYHEPDADVCAVMLQLANELELFDIAVKVGNILISMDPTGAPQHYVNLASAYAACERYDEGVALLQAAIPIFPEHADLWNVLGTTVRQRDGVEASLVFFEEGLRLEPNNFKLLSNHAQNLVMLGDYEGALALDERAIEANPTIAEPRVGAAQFLFHLGRLDEAWDHYEYRMDSRRKVSQNQIYTHNLPRWEGEDLEGKVLLVAAEQGIGDEVMWGNYLPRLYERAEKLVIGCDARLVSIYERSFPGAIVEASIDRITQGYRYRSYPKLEKAVKDGSLHIDFAVPLASAPRYEWHKREDIKRPQSGFCVPAPDLKARFAEKIQGISDRPKVGLAWRSGLAGAMRSYLYASIDDLAPLMALKDKVDFINLQYGECSSELEEARDKYGVEIHSFDGVDLKADIEANMAIASNCDLVISACTAPGMFAMGAGTPTLFMIPDKPWWCYGEEEMVPFAFDAEVVHAEKGAGWPKIMEEIVERTSRRLGL